MKKLIVLLIATLIIAGCSPKPLATLNTFDELPTIYFLDDPSSLDLLAEITEGTSVSYKLNRDTSQIDITLTKDKKEEIISQPVNILYDYITLSLGPSIKLYIDENENIVAFDYLNSDAEDCWSELTLVGQPVRASLTSLIDVAKEKDYLNDSNTDIEIVTKSTSSTLEEELNTLVTDYVENADYDLVVSLMSQKEDGQELLNVVDNLKSPIPGYWQMDTWEGKSYGWCINNGSCDGERVLVFGEDHTGYLVVYQGTSLLDGTKIPVRTMTFTWTDDGKVILDFFTDKYSVLGFGGDGVNFTFNLRDGVLTEHVSATETVTYHKVDKVRIPYSAKPTLGEWNRDPAIYYEPAYEDYMTDYNGIQAENSHYY